MGIQFGQNIKFTKIVVLNLEIGINWEHVLWHVHRNANGINLPGIIGLCNLNLVLTCKSSIYMNCELE